MVEIQISLFIGTIFLICSYIYSKVSFKYKIIEIKKKKGFKLYEWTGKTYNSSEMYPKLKKGHGHFKNEDSLNKYLKSIKIELKWYEQIE